MSQRGTYVIIEGIDGTGKTELATRLVTPLIGRGHSVSSFREPTDKFLHAEYNRLVKLDPFAAALSLTVDRFLLRSSIESALEQGDVVVQDRSYYSTLAYQFPALTADAWRQLERIEATLALEPDLILYLDAPVDLALKRVDGQGPRESEEDEPYIRRVKLKFEQMFQAPKWVRIDASKTRDYTLTQAMNALMAAGL